MLSRVPELLAFADRMLGRGRTELLGIAGFWNLRAVPYRPDMVAAFDLHLQVHFYLMVGPVGDSIMHGMHHAIAAYAGQGINCVVDYITYKQEWIPDLCDALQGLTVYFVGVDCPIDVLEQREKARGRVFVEGHARSHYTTVHEYVNNMYDLRVDTGTADAITCAQRIKEFITAHPKPQAFRKICTIKK